MLIKSLRTDIKGRFNQIVMIHLVSLHSLFYYYLLTHCRTSSQPFPYLSAPSLPPLHTHLAELICNEISFTFLCVLRLPANSHSQTEHPYPKVTYGSLIHGAVHYY